MVSLSGETITERTELSFMSSMGVRPGALLNRKGLWPTRKGQASEHARAVRSFIFVSF
jgi:hypothetical protein